VKIERLKVRQLLGRCDGGYFAVPEIQREFVWDTKRAANLFDSMYRGLPIGNILVWVAPPKFRYFLRKTSGVLPPNNPTCDAIWYLIDGQQRLAVFYQTREGRTVINSYDREVNFTHICFKLEDDGDTRFVRMGSPIIGETVRVSDILSPNWRQRLNYLSKTKRHVVDICRERLLDYKVPVLFMQVSDPELVRTTFLRINSGGMRVSAADIAFTSASRLDLRRLVNELRSALPRGYRFLDRRTVQFAAAVMLGLRDIKGGAIEHFLAKKEEEFIEDKQVTDEFTPLWHRIHHSITKAIDYLTSDIGVPNYEFLPSDNMLVTLASFFHANGCGQPNVRQGKEIRKWFWATAVGGRYTGRGYYQNIIGDIRFFERLANSASTKFRSGDRTPMSDLLRAEYRGSSSLTTAFFLLLQHQGPLFLENARPIPLGETASLKNRNDKHHVFPQALLRRSSVPDREVDRLCNICYMVAEDNQSFGSKPPKRYLADYRHAKHFARVMRSHLIPHYKGGGLWDTHVRNGYRKFLAERLQFVVRAFEKQAGGMRLFRKD
jgi:hypothetical protein